MPQHAEKQCEKLTSQIIDFSKHIAGTSQIRSACMCRYSFSESIATRSVIQVLLIIHAFQPKLMNYVKVIDGRSIVLLAADQWVFERDVDRGFLGEALAWELILPYYSLINEPYLHLHEIKLKKRLTLELLENLVLDFPELSYALYIKPEYFMHQAVLSRARLFPLITRGTLDFLGKGTKTHDGKNVLSGYLEAVKDLEKQGSISFSDGYVRISEDFVHAAGTPRTRLINLSKTLPRALFTSALGIFPKILGILSEGSESLFRLQGAEKDTAMTNYVGIPEKYVFVPTASGLTPLGSGLGIEATARKVLSMSSKEKIEVRAIGGILNDVFLVKGSTESGERKLVVKRFKDWSSFKWFPLALWSVGTRTFSILGRSRLERECAISQLLHSKGFSVPRLLCVSSDERLVFMEYITGETVSKVIRRFADSDGKGKSKKDLKTIERVGKKLAKVHAVNVVLGDTKPENMMIDEQGKIYLMDFEQASRGGDRAWDVAEFLYYAGHDISPLAQADTVEAIASAFITGYLVAGGEAETVRKAANPRYTKVFSVFTLPHIILAIANTCKRVAASQR